MSTREARPGAPAWRRSGTWAVLATAVGAAVRFAWCLVAVRPHVGSHDPAFYLRYAEHIAAGRGYVTDAGHATAYYPVGYPGLLGGVRWLLLHTPLPDGEPWMAAGVNLVFGIGSIALAAVLGRRVLGAWPGTVAAWLLALQPNLVYNTPAALTETVFLGVLLVALTLLLWRPLGERAGATRLVAAGAAFGLASLVRPVALALLPGLALVLLWQWRRRLPGRLRMFGVVAVVCLATLVPWVARNAVVMHRATLATNTGDNLCIGNNPSASGAFMLPTWCFGDFPSITDESIEVRRDRVLSARGLAWAVRHPVDEVRLVFWRTYWTFLSSHDGLRAVQSYETDPWLSTYHARIEQVLATAGDAYWFVTAALAMLGLLQWRRRPDARRAVLAMTVVALALVVWPFFGDTRFGLPVVALVAFPAASALEVFRRDGRRVVTGDDVTAGPLVDDDGDGSEEQPGEHRSVDDLGGQGPTEAGDGPGHDLAGDDGGAAGEHDERAGEAS